MHIPFRWTGAAGLISAALLAACQLNTQALIPVDVMVQQSGYRQPSAVPLHPSPSPFVSAEPTPSPLASVAASPSAVPQVEPGSILTPWVPLVAGQKTRLLYQLPDGIQEGIDLQLDGSGRVLYVGGLRNGAPLSKGLMLAGLNRDGQQVQMGYINAGERLNHKIPIESADRSLQTRAVYLGWLNADSLLLEARTE